MIFKRDTERSARFYSERRERCARRTGCLAFFGKAFFILEKSGGGQTDHISESDFIVQSYGRTLYEAACMNEEIKAVMLRANTLNEVSAVELNSDYNYTNAESKSYRYQAIFVVTHY